MMTILQKVQCSVGMHRPTACCVRRSIDGTFVSSCWRCDMPLLLTAGRWRTVRQPKRRPYTGRIAVTVLDPTPAE